jgi:hypothetical protein
MTSFHDWSIRHKLTGLFMAMACVTTVVISLPLGVFDFWGTKAVMTRDLAVLTDVLARNSTAAIVFHDADTGRDVLQALRAEPSITAACVYTRDDKPFATYVRDVKEESFVPPPAQAPVTRFERDRLVQFRQVTVPGRAIGFSRRFVGHHVASFLFSGSFAATDLTSAPRSGTYSDKNLDGCRLFGACQLSQPRRGRVVSVSLQRNAGSDRKTES